MLYVVSQSKENEGDVYHILKIRLSFSKKYEGPLEEILVDDNRSYSRNQLQVLLSTVHEGNKAFDSRRRVRSRTGGVVRLMSAKAIIGFIRFTSFYYMVIATELKPEGILLGHVIYSIAVAFPLSFEIGLRHCSAGGGEGKPHLLPDDSLHQIGHLVASFAPSHP